MSCFSFPLTYDSNFQINIESPAPSPMQVHSDVNNCSTNPNGCGLIEHERDVRLVTERTSEVLPEPLVLGGRDIPLCQRLLAAIISEEDCAHGNRGLEFDAYGAGVELEGELGSNCVNLNHVDNFQFSGHSPFNGYKGTGKPEQDETEIDILDIPNVGTDSNFRHTINGVLPDQALSPRMPCSELQYDNMRIDEKLHLELQSLGIFPEPMVCWSLFQCFIFE